LTLAFLDFGNPEAAMDCGMSIYQQKEIGGFKYILNTTRRKVDRI
jgi:hypothetical protein